MKPVTPWISSQFEVAEEMFSVSDWIRTKDLGSALQLLARRSGVPPWASAMPHTLAGIQREASHCCTGCATRSCGGSKSGAKSSAGRTSARPLSPLMWPFVSGNSNGMRSDRTSSMPARSHVSSEATGGVRLAVSNQHNAHK